MKKFLLPFMLIALSIGYSCSDDEGGGNSNPPECSVTAPEDGAILDLYEDLVIKGTASDSDGTIAEVALTVDGKIVAEVTKTPFEYTIPAKDLKVGILKIKLAVEDDCGNTATDEISVVIQDLSKAPVCHITAPAHGAELNAFAPFSIKGEGEAVSGEISKVTLKINDDVIAAVTALPFEYEVAAATYPLNSYTITLEVENSRGLVNKDMVTVTLIDGNAAPVCSITEPADGASFEPTDVIVVKGTGSDEDGTIAKAVLKINGNVVESVTNVPFEYTLTDEQKQPGNVKIALEVTDNYGKTSTDEATVVILGRFREFTDSRDGKTYKTVKIGDQLWFAENCAYLPQVMKPSEYSAEAPCYYVYDYDGNDVAAAKATENYRNEGVLYNWLAAGGSMDSKNDAVPSGIQGPCPDGWHIPSEAEWEILYKYVRDRIPENEAALYWDGVTKVYNVSGHLRANVWPIKEDPDFPQLTKGGMDTYGFAIRPSGCLLGRNGFYYGPGAIGSNVSFWTPHYDGVTYPSSPGGVTTGVSNYKYEPDFGRGTARDRAYPVRCLQN